VGTRAAAKDEVCLVKSEQRPNFLFVTSGRQDQPRPPHLQVPLFTPPEGTSITLPVHMQDGDKRNSGATPVESSRDVASEDFLYHLYRGSELLQDNRAHEAKEELEAALLLQPRDTKGQDLLALTYFRIGLYPRSIQIYEQLRKELPHDPSLMINLALCYLKTGQSQQARAVLEELVTQSPEHKRAWGYLGLAYDRLGDLEKAEESFTRAGHEAMAKRLAERRESMSMPPPALPTAQQVQAEQDREESAEIRKTAEVAFAELDSGELSFALAEPAVRRTESGTWRAVELGEAVKSIRTNSERPPAMPDFAPLSRHPSPDKTSSTARIARPFANLAKDARLAPAVGELISQHASGLVVVVPHDDDTELFAGRLDAVRGYTGTLTTRVLERQSRAVSHEPFGGLGAPLVRMKTSGTLVLGPRPSHRLVPLKLDGELAFVREEYVLGFDLRLTFENGRLGFGEGETLPFAQLTGKGVIVLELLDPLVVVDVAAKSGAVLRREAIVGWTGRLLPRALAPSESPSGQRGLVSFSGDGSLLMSGR